MEFDLYLRDKPHDLDMRLMQVMALVRTGRVGEAEARARAILEIQEDHPGAIRFLDHLEKSRGK